MTFFTGLRIFSIRRPDRSRHDAFHSDGFEVQICSIGSRQFCPYVGGNFPSSAFRPHVGSFSTVMTFFIFLYSTFYYLL